MPWSDPGPHCRLSQEMHTVTVLQEGDVRCTQSSSTLHSTHRLSHQARKGISCSPSTCTWCILSISCDWPGSYNYSCCSSLWQPTPSKPQGFTTATPCSGCPWEANSETRLQCCKSLQQYHQHFTLHQSAAKISFACCLKHAQKKKLY